MSIPNQVSKGSNLDMVLIGFQMLVMNGNKACITIRNGEAETGKSNIPNIAVNAEVM